MRNDEHPFVYMRDDERTVVYMRDDEHTVHATHLKFMTFSIPVPALQSKVISLGMYGTGWSPRQCIDNRTRKAVLFSSWAFHSSVSSTRTASPQHVERDFELQMFILIHVFCEMTPSSRSSVHVNMFITRASTSTTGPYDNIQKPHRRYIPSQHPPPPPIISISQP